MGNPALLLGTAPSPWNDANITDGPQAKEMLDLARTAASDLWPRFVTILEPVIQRLGIQPPGSLDEVASFLALLDDLERVLGRLDPAAEIRQNALRAARGHTNGPRKVHLPEGWLDLVDDPTPPLGAELAHSGG